MSENLKAIPKTYDLLKWLLPVVSTHRTVIEQNAARFKRRMKSLVNRWKRKLVSIGRIARSIHSWLGYAKHADSYNMRRRLFAEIKLTG